MNRQFLRVYVGIALVLMLAGVGMHFLVEREVRQIADRRLEEAMAPWIEWVRTQLVAAGGPEQRTAALEKLNETAPFVIRLMRRGGAGLSGEESARLATEGSVLAGSGEERLFCAVFDENQVMVMGPLQPTRGGRPPFPRREDRLLHPDRPPPPWGGDDSFAHPDGPPFLHGGGTFPHPEGPPAMRSPFSPQPPYFLLGALLAILVLIGTAVYLLLRPFERRIYALADVARRLGEGQLDTRSPVAGDDAIATLAGTFNDMATRIEQFVERQQELLRAVSHELRTPLARLFFVVDDAQGAKTAAEKDRYLERIEGTLQEINELVEELLTFVRLEGDAAPPAKEPIQTQAVLEEVARQVMELRRDLTLQVHCECQEVVGVPRLFRRAVLNLAANAARYARERIEITCAVVGETVQVRMDDDGPGIPSEARQRIFEPFFRLDESRSASSGGTGLGLAIVQRIMALHGGQVRVEESPLGGARFTLSLPVA